MADNQVQIEQLQTGDYVAVEVKSKASTLKAIKKYLAPDGPFHLHSSRYTILERKNVGARTDTSTVKMQTQLVLGGGLHHITFQGVDLFIHYNTSGEESITIYCKNEAVVIAKPPPKDTVSPPPIIAESTGDDNGNISDATPTTESTIEPIAEPAEPMQSPASAQEVLALFLTCANEYQYKTENDFIVVLSMKEDTLMWDSEIIRPKRPISSVVLCNGVKEQIIADLELFRADKKFYRQHGIPYKRSYLLHGPPGCGKTSLISALASQYDLTICPIPLSNPKITDNVLISLMTSAPPDSIIVLEDIDIVFTTHGIFARNAAASSTGITFSGLTNALDGVTSTEDKIIIMTTNFRDKLRVFLDKLPYLEAMMRPGRIDRIFEISYADADALYELFLQYYPGKKKQANLFKNYVVGRNITTAYIQNFFLKYKGDPHTAWENCQAFIDDYEKEMKSSEERRKKYEDEERKKDAAGGFLGLF